MAGDRMVGGRMENMAGAPPSLLAQLSALLDLDDDDDAVCSCTVLERCRYYPR